MSILQEIKLDRLTANMVNIEDRQFVDSIPFVVLPPKRSLGFAVFRWIHPTIDCEIFLFVVLANGNCTIARRMRNSMFTNSNPEYFWKVHDTIRSTRDLMEGYHFLVSQ